VHVHVDAVCAAAPSQLRSGGSLQHTTSHCNTLDVDAVHEAALHVPASNTPTNKLTLSTQGPTAAVGGGGGGGVGDGESEERGASDDILAALQRELASSHPHLSPSPPLLYSSPPLCSPVPPLLSPSPPLDHTARHESSQSLLAASEAHTMHSDAHATGGISETSSQPHCSALQHTAAHGSTLQHTAAHGNTLQHAQETPSQPRSGGSLQHTATHCNTLQHTATHSRQSSAHLGEARVGGRDLSRRSGGGARECLPWLLPQVSCLWCSVLQWCCSGVVRCNGAREWLLLHVSCLYCNVLQWCCSGVAVVKSVVIGRGSAYRGFCRRSPLCVAVVLQWCRVV